MEWEEGRVHVGEEVELGCWWEVGRLGVEVEVCVEGRGGVSGRWMWWRFLGGDGGGFTGDCTGTVGASRGGNEDGGGDGSGGGH